MARLQVRGLAFGTPAAEQGCRSKQGSRSEQCKCVHPPERGGLVQLDCCVQEFPCKGGQTWYRWAPLASLFMSSNYKNTQFLHICPSVTKTDITETESGIIDQLVSKQPETNSKYKWIFFKKINKTNQKNSFWISLCSYALSHHCTVVWVTRPECPKGPKPARRAAT